MNSEERILRLERENRRMRVIFATGLAGLVLAFVWQRQEISTAAFAQQNRPVSTVLRTQNIEVVNKQGLVVFSVKSLDEGANLSIGLTGQMPGVAAHVSINAVAEQPYLMMSGNSPLILVSDDTGRVKITAAEMEVTPLPSSVLNRRHMLTLKRLVKELTDEEQEELQDIKDDSPVVRLSRSKDNTGSVEVANSIGKSAVSIRSNKGRGVVSVHDVNGNVANSLTTK